MKLFDYIFRNKILLTVMALWCIITILRIANHIPWYDEAHAWDFAKSLTFSNLITSLNFEGHNLLWFLCLMPFAKLNFGYPYIMQILNWTFCLSALIIFWKNAPFNNPVKVFITFSFPFLACYSVIARCYAISILCLFILTSYFKNRIKKPILYSVLIAISLNTSFMATICIVPITLIYIYDLIKSKLKLKTYLYCGVIIFIGALISSFSLTSKAIREYKELPVFTDVVKNQFTSLPVITTVFIILIIICTVLIRKQIRPLFILLCSYSLLTYGVTCVYQGSFWHNFFYLIYLIITLWIYFEQEIPPLHKKVLTVILSFFAFINWFYPQYSKDFFVDVVFKQMKNGFSESEVINYYLKDSNLQKYPLILGYSYLGYCIKNYPAHGKLINYCADKTFKDFLAFQKGKFCYEVQENNIDYFVTAFSKKELANIIDKNGDSYTYDVFDLNLLSPNDTDFYKFSVNNKNYEIKKYKCLNGDENCFYHVKRLN